MNISDEKIKEVIQDFLAEALPEKEFRAKTFSENLPFVLGNNQWGADEKAERLGDPTLTFNYSEDYLEKYLSRLFPRSSRTGVMDVGVKVFESDSSELRENYEDEILSTYRQNNLPSILLEQGTNFLVGGVGCLYYPQNPITKKIEVVSLDPSKVYVSFLNGEVNRFAFEVYSGGKKTITYWDKNNSVKIIDDDVQIQENKSGLIPFSWIPNFPVPHNKGKVRNKIDSLKSLEKEYNKSASDYSKRIEENTDPHLCVFSKQVKAGDIERGKKKITKLGPDDDMKYLELKEGREILEYLDLIDTRMKRKTGIVDMSGSIKSALSGVSFAFQYSDMLDHIGFMRIFWDQAFRNLNRAILTYKFSDGNFDTDPIYNQPIQFDEMNRVEQYQKMLEMGVISRQDVIEELRGAENSQEKLKEIEAEKELFYNEQQKYEENKRDEQETELAVG